MAVPKARALLYLLIAVSLGASLRAGVGEPPPLPWVVALLVLLPVTLVLGALRPSWQMYGDVLSSVPEARGRVALTFDDGPELLGTPLVLDLLRERGVHATFFVLGERALLHPHLIRRMVAEGHAVGLHSRDHYRGYAFLSPGGVAADIDFCRTAIRAAFDEGGEPVDLPLIWFRPPVGQSSPRTFAGLRRTGAEMVGWSVKTWDGLRRTTAGEVTARVRRDLMDGAIVLLHDAWERPLPGETEPPAGVRALAEILDICDERGLKPVTLDELVAGGAQLRQGAAEG